MRDILGPDEPGGEGAEDSGPFGLKNQQINWLKNDLRNVDRKKTPWVIAGEHDLVSHQVYLIILRSWPSALVRQY